VVFIVFLSFRILIPGYCYITFESTHFTLV
jgi:hypothetical protein